MHLDSTFLLCCLISSINLPIFLLSDFTTLTPLRCLCPDFIPLLAHFATALLSLHVVLRLNLTLPRRRLLLLPVCVEVAVHYVKHLWVDPVRHHYLAHVCL
jgi:hypothetical protein